MLQKNQGRTLNPSALSRRDGFSQISGASSPHLNLNKRYERAAPRYDINLALRATKATRKNPVAFKPQQPHG